LALAALHLEHCQSDCQADEERVDGNEHEAGWEKVFHGGGVALVLDVFQRAANLWLPAGLAIGVGHTYILSVCRWSPLHFEMQVGVLLRRERPPAL
jgi:hypothetical protein